MSGGTDETTGGSTALLAGAGSATFAAGGAAATVGWLGATMGCGVIAPGWLDRSAVGGGTGLLTATSVRSGAGGVVPWPAPCPASAWLFGVCGSGAGMTRGGVFESWFVLTETRARSLVSTELPGTGRTGFSPSVNAPFPGAGSGTGGRTTDGWGLDTLLETGMGVAGSVRETGVTEGVPCR